MINLLFALLLAPARAEVTVAVETLAVDGVEVRDLSCSLDKGGLMAAFSVVAAISGQKPALDACAPAGAAMRAQWTWAGGQTASVGVTQSSAPAASSCVQSALKAVQTPISGQCSAVLLVGDAAGAQKAAAALPPAAP